MSGAGALGDEALEAAVRKRLIWNAIPAAAIVAVTGVALFGEDGIVERHALKQRLLATVEQVEAVERENDSLRAEIRRFKNDPTTVRRAAAERLLVAEKGSTIYRFEEGSRPR